MRRFEIRTVAKGWSYRPEIKVGKEGEQGSLWTAFTNELNTRQAIWSLVDPDFKVFEPGQEVICCLEAAGEKSWRLIGIAGISKIDAGLPIIDPARKIGDLDQPKADSVIFDAKQASNREEMPTYYP